MDECIIRTLAYFDIFDYPLTFSEIKKYLCCKLDISDNDLYDLIESISVIQESGGYYYLLGRNKLASLRSERVKISIPKHSKARIFAKILSYIPTIRYIGLSGSLSMNNASFSDDIDFFIVTSKNTLWITRLTVNLVLMAARQKRGRDESLAKDKICPNMFVSIDRLSINSKRKTLYTAHEIVHLNSLVDKDKVYMKLHSDNLWVQDFFPNIIIRKTKTKKEKSKNKFLSKALSKIDIIFYKVQKLYMKKRGSETVNQKKALFHPQDRQKIIMDLYQLRAKRYTELMEDNYWVDRDEARFYMEEKKIRILN